MVHSQVLLAYLIRASPVSSYQMKDLAPCVYAKFEGLISCMISPQAMNRGSCGHRHRGILRMSMIGSSSCISWCAVEHIVGLNGLWLLPNMVHLPI